MKATLLALMFLALTGCGGTETGNPGGNLSGVASGSGPGSGGSVSPNSAEVQEILTAICAKLNACDGLSTTTCENGLLPVTNIAPALGLSASFGSVQAMLSAAAAGTIVPHSADLSTCVSDIEALSCSNSSVTNAYSSSSPNDFNSVVQLIPTTSTSCAGVF